MNSASQRSKVSGIEPSAFAWDFDGACVPHRPGHTSLQETFSVGVFQWLPKKNGSGLKRGKVVHRFHGHVSNPQAVYEKAHAYLERPDALK